MGTLLALMAVTVISVYYHVEESAENVVRSSLGDLAYQIEGKNDWATKKEVAANAEMLSEYIEDAIKEGISLLDLFDLFCGNIESFVCTEMDIIDPNGIILASSETEKIGSDIHSNDQLSEFQCLLDGSKKVYSSAWVSRPSDGTLIQYYGSIVPGYEGILLKGYTQDDAHIYKRNLLSNTLKSYKFERTGYYLYLDNDLKILGGPDTVQKGESLSLSYDIRELAKNGGVVKDEVFGVRSFVGAVPDDREYIGAVPDDQEYIVAVYSLSEAWQMWNILMVIFLIISVVVFTMLFLLVNLLLAKKVVLGVYSLSNTLGLISEGKLEEKADFRNSLEFDRLSDGINLTVERLKELIKEAEGRIDKDLVLAARIQTSFLPHVFPPFPDRDEFDLYACTEPAKEVGGNFYDFFFADPDHLVLVIADVSGRGLPAAMFMLMAKDKIRNSVQKYGTDVAEAIREVNHELLQESDSGFFVTVWLGVLTVSTGHIDYVNAGQEYPALYRTGGEFRAERDIHCVPVSAVESAVFKAGSFELEPGDALYLYTYGVTEVNDPEGEMFGRSRLLKVLNKNKDASAQEIDAAVRSAITEFTKDAPQPDDITTVCFRYKG